MSERLNHESDTRFVRSFAMACFMLFATWVRIMALFGGAKLRNRWAAFLFPLSGPFVATCL